MLGLDFGLLGGDLVVERPHEGVVGWLAGCSSVAIGPTGGKVFPDIVNVLLVVGDRVFQGLRLLLRE